MQMHRAVYINLEMFIHNRLFANNQILQLTYAVQNILYYRNFTQINNNTQNTTVQRFHFTKEP